PVEGPPGDAPAPLWQIQTGMIRQQSAGIRIDDQSVSVPRREASAAVTGFHRPDFEERIRRAPAVEAPRRVAEVSAVPWGTLSQVLGGLLLVAALGLMGIVLLL